MQTLLASVAITLLMGACDKEPVEESISFPELQTIECEAGDVTSFSFTTNHDWQLSSDALWCMFISSAGEVLDMSGKAGTHTISLRISDLELGNKPTEANITMKISDKTELIAKVVRGAENPYLIIYDTNDAPTNGIELGYGSYITFHIEANFRFAAVEYPEWVEFEGGSVSGNAGERVEGRARIINDGYRERYPITEEDGYRVIFADESGDIRIEIAILYGGMGGENLSFTGPSANTFGWEVSLDGKSFRQEDEATSEVINYPSPLKYLITAHNDEYYVLSFEKVVDCGIPSYRVDAEWINFDKEEMTLSVEASQKTRFGMVLALPSTVYNEVAKDIMGNLFEMDNASGIDLQTLKYDYLKYLLIEFTQLDFDESGPYEGMRIYHSLTTYEIPYTPYQNGEVMSKYDVSEAYTCRFPAPIEGKRPGVVIDPRTEGWNSESFEQGTASVELYCNGEQLTIKEADFMLGENTDEIISLHFYGMNGVFDSNVEILFKVGQEAKKLLVVTPPAK